MVFRSDLVRHCRLSAWGSAIGTAFALLLSPVGASRPAAAESGDAVSIELRILATRIIEVAGQGKSFRVSGFKGPGSGHPELQIKLGQALMDLGATLDPIDYDLDIGGRFEQFDGERGTLGVRIIAELYDDGGRPYAKLVGQLDGAEEPPPLIRELMDSEATPRLLGISSSIGHNVPEPERSRRLREQMTAPPVRIEETIAFESDEQRYGIEVLVKQGYAYVARPLTAVGRRNLPFVPLESEDIYAIRLINRTSLEAAVLLSVDGINVFHFAEGDNTNKRWLVPPANDGVPGTVLIRGWSKDDRQSLEFRVTSFPETAAARLHLEPNPDIGQITAQFSAAWPVDADPPLDEGRSRGTGFGATIEDEKVDVPRNIGGVRATVIVRYER